MTQLTSVLLLCSAALASGALLKRKDFKQFTNGGGINLSNGGLTPMTPRPTSAPTSAPVTCDKDSDCTSKCASNPGASAKTGTTTTSTTGGTTTTKKSPAQTTASSAGTLSGGADRSDCTGCACWNCQKETCTKAAPPIKPYERKKGDYAEFYQTSAGAGGGLSKAFYQYCGAGEVKYNAAEVSPLVQEKGTSMYNCARLCKEKKLPYFSFKAGVYGNQYANDCTLYSFQGVGGESVYKLKLSGMSGEKVYMNTEWWQNKENSNPTGKFGGSSASVACGDPAESWFPSLKSDKGEAVLKQLDTSRATFKVAEWSGVPWDMNFGAYGSECSAFKNQSPTGGGGSNTISGCTTCTACNNAQYTRCKNGPEEPSKPYVWDAKTNSATLVSANGYGDC